MKLGQILLHRGIIDRDQLRNALRRQEQLDVPLGEVLLRMGVVARDQVVDAMRRQPHASIDGETLRRVPPETLAALPSGLCREIGCVPVVDDPEIMILAMTDPADSSAISRISKLLGKPVGAIAGPAEVIAELNSHPAARPDTSPATLEPTA